MLDANFIIIYLKYQKILQGFTAKKFSVYSVNLFIFRLVDFFLSGKAKDFLTYLK